MPLADPLLTPPQYVGIITDFFGEIDLDPCWREGSPIKAATKYVLPEKNGLVERWIGRTYVNMPWGYDWKTTGDTIRPWLRRCADFKRGCESLAYIPSAPNSAYWRALVFPFATAIAFVGSNPVVRFKHADGHEEPIDVAFVYYGGWTTHFATVFGSRWPVVRPLR